MSAIVPMNPRPMLQSLIDKQVLVRLKWNDMEYQGRLVSADSYMNLQISGTHEVVDGVLQGTLGMVLIRCNNVLWIKEAEEAVGANGDGGAVKKEEENGDEDEDDEEDEEGDVKME